MAVFQSKYAGQAFWLGSKKIKFRKGMYQTDDQAEVTFLSKQKACILVPAPQVSAPAPASAPVQAVPSPEPPAPVPPSPPPPAQPTQGKKAKGE
jgi:hypothetical protein